MRRAGALPNFMVGLEFCFRRGPIIQRFRSLHLEQHIRQAIRHNRPDIFLRGSAFNAPGEIVEREFVCPLHHAEKRRREKHRPVCRREVEPAEDAWRQHFVIVRHEDVFKHHVPTDRRPHADRIPFA